MTAPIALAQWAARHAISAAALTDLLQVMGVGERLAPEVTPGKTSEAYAQSLVRREAPRFGVWLTRNNVGALQDSTGRPVRYGLANETKAQNEGMKSADLIGIRSVTITLDMVGNRIGQFVSREVKHPAWQWGEDLEREEAQLAWAMLITKYGGDAQFATGEGSFST